MKTIILVFLFTLALAGCSKGLEPNPINLSNSPLDPSELVISITPITLLADGKAQATVAVKTGVNAIKLYKTATLSIQGTGKFLDGTKNSTISLNSSGEGSTLVWSDSIGVSTINVTVGSLTQSKTITFVNNQFSLTASNTTPADNESYAEIVANSGIVSNAGTSVTFKTTGGRFANGLDSQTVTLSSQGSAKVYLKYSQAETVFVRASISGIYTTEIPVKFVRAYPQQIYITTGANTLLPRLTSETSVMAMLVRTKGTPTSGQFVQFYDSTTTGTHPGIFLNASLSNAAGIANALYKITDTSYRGTVFVKAFSDTDLGRIYGANIIIIQ